MRRRLALVAAVAAATFAPRAARANAFPTRGGESGVLDVPSAYVLDRGASLLAGELRLDRVPGQSLNFGPLPLSVVAGLGGDVEAGFAMREGGNAGDPRPSPVLFTGSLKWHIADRDGSLPALAADLAVDRFNKQGVTALRVIASDDFRGQIRWSAFAGLEAHGPGLNAGPTVGVAGAVPIAHEVDAALQALASPRGPLVGGALRFAQGSKVGMSVGLNWTPSDGGFRFSVGYGVYSPAKAKKRALKGPQASPEEKPVELAPAKPRFTDERPHFRLRLRHGDPEDGRRHLQYAQLQLTAKAYVAGPRLAAAPAPDAAQRELAQAVEQLDARERRLRANEAALTSRRGELAAKRAELEAEERALAPRVRALDQQEAGIKGVYGKPNDEEQKAAANEQRHRASEEQYARAEAAARDAAAAARARADEAFARERSLSGTVTQLQSLVAREKKGSGLGQRQQLVAARADLLAAVEARLSAARVELEELGSANDAHAARVAAIESRLAARERRLELVERRSAKPPAALATAPAAPPATGTAAVVPVPSAPAVPPAPAAVPVAAPATSVAVAVPATSAPAAPPAASAEKTVLASSLALVGAGQQLRPTDRQGIEKVAQAAVRGGGDVSVWVRIPGDALAADGARLEGEAKAIAAAAGLPAERITARTTRKTSALGVELVVSAVRQGPAAPAAKGGEGASR